MTGGEGKYTWIGQAIAENFQADLAKAGFAIATAVPDRPGQNLAIADANEAHRIATNSKAEVVIFGSYQFVDPDLRVTGQILDVPSAQLVGALKASATFRQLFTLEDDLADQARKALIGDQKNIADAGPAIEPRPPLAPKGEYDTDRTAADDRPIESKIPYAQPNEDYLGYGYSDYYYP